MKKLAIVLLGMLAAVSSLAVFYLPLTTEPIENAILPTIVAAAVGLASGAIIGRLSGPASSDQRAPAATPTYRRRNTYPLLPIACPYRRPLHRNAPGGEAFPRLPPTLLIFP